MKRFIMRCALFAACMSGPAVAADLPIEAPVYVERPAAVGLWNWTGFYVGANLGYARSPGSADIMVAGVPLLSLSENMNGVIGGIQAGANWQTGNAVFGIEADVQGTSQSASSSITVVDATRRISCRGRKCHRCRHRQDHIIRQRTRPARRRIGSGSLLCDRRLGLLDLVIQSDGDRPRHRESLEFPGRRRDRRWCRARRCARLDCARRIPLLAVHHHLEHPFRRAARCDHQQPDSRQCVSRRRELCVFYGIGGLQAACLLASCLLARQAYRAESLCWRCWLGSPARHAAAPASRAIGSMIGSPNGLIGGATRAICRPGSARIAASTTAGSTAPTTAEPSISSTIARALRLAAVISGMDTAIIAGICDAVLRDRLARGIGARSKSQAPVQPPVSLINPE